MMRPVVEVEMKKSGSGQKVFIQIKNSYSKTVQNGMNKKMAWHLFI